MSAPGKARTIQQVKVLVQRGYLLTLWVKVPPLEFPVWQRSYTRQSLG
jgi:hypothetical protein